MKELIKLLEECGVNYTTAAIVKVKDLAKKLNKSTTIIYNTLDLLEKNGRIIQCKDYNKRKIIFTNDLEKDIKFRKLSRIKKFFLVGADIKFNQGNLSKKTQGSIVQSTDYFFCVNLKKFNKHGQEVHYKENFLYSDIIDKQIKNLKINGKQLDVFYQNNCYQIMKG